jgi:hypothetical protein
LYPADHIFQTGGTDVSNNTVQGNYIGTTADGLLPLGNALEGIDISFASDNLIGGGASGAGNVISGNLGHQVAVSGDDNRVQGNFIGTDKTGSTGLANDNAGVSVGFNVSFNIIGADGDEINDDNERNIIAANGANGVQIWRSSHNTVAGNWIGIGLDGAPLGNTGNGISLLGGSHSNWIGTNVISDNSGDGISSPSAWGVNNDNIIAGNYIGTDVTGTAAMGNGGSGIWLADSSGTIIGGTETGVGNTIAFNTGTGVAITGAIAVGNSIRGNSIFDNGELGIDLVGGIEDAHGVTANDDGDPDVGPNLLQNFPTVSLADAGASTHVVGSFNSTAYTEFTLDFYANTTADPSGFGEGERFLDSITVTTEGSGNANFDEFLPAATSPGEFITATATHPDGNTSEFSGAEDVEFLRVEIDIKPGSDQNTINLGSNGVVPVAILSSLTFDAITVDPLSVTLANAGVKLRGNGSPQTIQQDVNNDGLIDLVVHVETEALQLTEGDVEAVLEAQTYGGTLIRGSDTIRIVPDPGNASAVDAAFLSWAELDSSDDDDADPLATQAADELALMLVE